MRYIPILLVCLLIGIPTVQAQSCDPTLSLNTAQEFADRGRACYNERNNDQAAADLNRAIELDPGFAPAYSSRGWLNYRQGQYQSAISDFSYAIQLDPNLADPYWGRGEVYAVQEQLDLALADYKRYLEVAGDSANPNIEDRVRTLESEPLPPGSNRNALLTALASIIVIVVLYTRLFARRKPTFYPTRRQRTPQARVTDERVSYDPSDLSSQYGGHGSTAYSRARHAYNPDLIPVKAKQLTLLSFLHSEQNSVYALVYLVKGFEKIPDDSVDSGSLHKRYRDYWESPNVIWRFNANNNNPIEVMGYDQVISARQNRFEAMLEVLQDEGWRVVEKSTPSHDLTLFYLER